VSEPAEPYKEFIREMTLRIERAMRQFAREAREDRLRAQEDHQQLFEELRDLREESRAQRQALLRILDRLDGKGGPQPAT
jgi:hypothetical protein